MHVSLHHYYHYIYVRILYDHYHYYILICTLFIIYRCTSAIVVYTRAYFIPRLVYTPSSYNMKYFATSLLYSSLCKCHSTRRSFSLRLFSLFFPLTSLWLCLSSSEVSRCFTERCPRSASTPSTSSSGSRQSRGRVRACILHIKVSPVGHIGREFLLRGGGFFGQCKMEWLTKLSASARVSWRGPRLTVFASSRAFVRRREAAWQWRACVQDLVWRMRRPRGRTWAWHDDRWTKDLSRLWQYVPQSETRAAKIGLPPINWNLVSEIEVGEPRDLRACKHSRNLYTILCKFVKKRRKHFAVEYTFSLNVTRL